MSQEELPDNPFVSGALRNVVGEVMISAFRLASVSIHVEPTGEELTDEYLAMLAEGVGRLIDESVAGHALCFELAVMVWGMTDDNGVDVRNECTHAACAEKHAACNAFIEAASRGDWPAVVNVMKAIGKEAVQRQQEPFIVLGALWSEVMILLVKSASAAVEKEHGKPERN